MTMTIDRNSLLTLEAYAKIRQSSRAEAMSMPGIDLSQPASSTEPSRRSAMMTVSTESAMTSRETSE